MVEEAGFGNVVGKNLSFDPRKGNASGLVFGERGDVARGKDRGLAP